MTSYSRRSFVTLLAAGGTGLWAQGGGSKGASALPERGICAHRGAMDTHPENTIPSFQEAIAAGAHMIEMDVQLAADGELIVMHDLTVDRTTNGRGEVAGMTLRELMVLDAGLKKGKRFAGVRIPTFAQALEIMPRNVWLNCHLKGGARVGAEAAKALLHARRESQAFLAATPEQAKAARETQAEIQICNMGRGTDAAEYVRDTIAMKAQFIQLQSKSGVSRELVAPLLARGIKVNCFFAVTPDQVREWMPMGIDFPLVNNIRTFMPVAREMGLQAVVPIF